MSENDLYFGCEVPCMTTPPMRTIWRLEQQNHKLKLIMCWAIALTFAVAFGLGYFIGKRMGA